MNENIIRKIDRIHPYPAKFTVDLAINYINKYSKIGDTIYDPFVGSGTTLLASNVLNRKSYGTDINHIAILISKFKLLKLSKVHFEELKLFIEDFKNNYKNGITSVELYSYPSINHWFCDDAIKVLSYIKYKIDNLPNDETQTFCKLVMSSIINTVSNQESDTRYAAIVKPKLNTTFIAETFIKKFNNSLNLYKEFSKELTQSKSIPILYNSKKCDDKIKEHTIDLILTSPPYPNTYDYYLYHKHRMNWLGYDVSYSMNSEIGSRREFSSLKKPKEKFDSDMFEILTSCNKLLKHNGYVVLVMGDGKIAGKIYEAKSNMIRICGKLGWELVDYSFTYLDNTSRSFQKSYRTKGKKEHIIVFRKK